MAGSIIFGLGILASRWKMSHHKRRIRITMTTEQQPYVDVLTQHFGGCQYLQRGGECGRIAYELSSSASLFRLRAAVVKYRLRLPAQFVQDFLLWFEHAGQP